ncbi:MULTISPECIES: acyltransferase [Asticcacaulis]|uniref:acyltransferase family protein n=1 Tax=Asticcacaulis TaxID=76890 RepID=UPI001AE57299|nr:MULTISPECIES: acyltransferase [Asticcacaulis]MBP2161336.1 peptidoglycan/LPS O-acetylase OafA/YrhL [Asticcacaulis solisilvae]MDR6802298.1 peptidoglycan/LPS O-acetylase OafA/YrhL [Asticcacaulis sp. BE141]
MSLSTTTAAPAKSHFIILDGLRGVASLMVVVFHLFEAYAGGSPQNQIINHGYLAVDFFFLLSGFVVAYAYDDRWAAGMTQWEFYKRRLVRLQPMIIVGSLIGAALFAFQHYSIFPKVENATLWQIIIVTLIGMTMIPLPPSADIRGWNETYPVNGPAWSLFYEYVANILYAVGVRKLPKWALGILVVIAGAALVHLAVFGKRGDLIGGWALDADGITIGLTRVMFPFFAGVLLMRLGMRIKVPSGFLVCSLLLLVALCLPRFGGTEKLWMNGIYEAACVILLFPLIVAIGAGEKEASGVSVKVAKVFGDLSYPLYITHYPLIYIYTGWVVDRKIPPEQGALVGAGVFVATVAIAWLSLKLWDEPARRWLAGKLLKRAG